MSTPSEKEVEDFYNNNKQRYVATRGVALAAIVVDPADNGGDQDDAKGEAEAKQKIRHHLPAAQGRRGLRHGRARAERGPEQRCAAAT